MFFQNCWNWVYTNAAQIAAVLSAICTGSTIANIWSTIKNFCQIRKYKSSQDELTAAIQSSKDNTEYFESLEYRLKDMEQRFSNLQSSVQVSSERMDSILSKVSAMLEVQSIVYQTVKDENTRILIQNIITNAKYSETQQRNQLIAQIEKLKQEAKELANKNLQKIEDAASAVKTVLSPVENDVMRS